MESVLIAIGLMTGLGIILSTILAVSGKLLYVYQDPRIEQVDNVLPQANCGACGLPGCKAFAERVVSGAINPGKCTVSSESDQKSIAELLSITLNSEEKRVARLACDGGANVARQRAEYQGQRTCHSANIVAGGGKGCAWGCLGLADCEVVCDFDAITMNAQGIPEVNNEACTSCGDCVDICPRDLFSLEPVSRKLWVACKNELKNEEAEIECEVACTACEKCVRGSSPGLMVMKNNLPVIDYEKNHLANIEAISNCPTGAIVWIEKNGRVVKGLAAKKIIRESPLPVGG